jgi:hypothetical protein
MKMKRSFLALALLASAVPVAAQKVEVAEGDWSSMPMMRFVDLQSITPEAVVSIQRLVTSGECEIAGVSKRQVDMTVPFLVRFSPNGAVEHVVLRKIGCPKAEGILAGAVLGLLKAGTFKPTGENKTGWYRSELSFASS